MSNETKGFKAVDVANTRTDIEHVLDHMNAGVFKEKLEIVLSHVVMGVINHGSGKKKGQVTVTLDISQLGENQQVEIEHTLKYKQPTKRGNKAEIDSTSTSFHVGRGGKLSFNQPKEDDNRQYSLEQETDGILARGNQQ